MSAPARWGGTDLVRDLDDATLFVRSVSFPAARDDLLLQAIVTHATPRLIGTLRSLPETIFPDAESVVAALAGR